MDPPTDHITLAGHPHPYQTISNWGDAALLPKILRHVCLKIQYILPPTPMPVQGLQPPPILPIKRGFTWSKVHNTGDLTVMLTLNPILTLTLILPEAFSYPNPQPYSVSNLNLNLTFTLKVCHFWGWHFCPFTMPMPFTRKTHQLHPENLQPGLRDVLSTQNSSAFKV